MLRRHKPIFRPRRRWRPAVEILALAVGLLIVTLILAATITELAS